MGKVFVLGREGSRSEEARHGEAVWVDLKEEMAVDSRIVDQQAGGTGLLLSDSRYVVVKSPGMAGDCPRVVPMHDSARPS